MRFISSKVEVGRAIGLYAAGSLSAGIVGFFALPVFTRLFTPEEFGVIGLFTAAVGLLTPTLSLVGFVFVLFDDRRETISSGVPVATILIASLGAAIAVSIAVVASVAGVVPNMPWRLVLLALVTAWANVWVSLRLHTYQADEMPGRFFALSATPPLAAFIGTVLLALLVAGWLSRVLALAIVAGAAAIWSALSLGRRSRLSLRAGLERFRDVARFGAPLVITSATAWVVGFTDRFIVAERVGLAAAGIYTVAYALGLGVSSAHDGVARFFVSRLKSAVTSDQGRRDAARFAYRYAAISLGTVPLVVLVGLWALGLLASDAFQDGSELLVWLIPAQTFAGIARVFVGYVYVEHRTGQRALLSLTEAVINVALTWILVGEMGTVGAAIATLVTYIVAMVGTIWLARTWARPGRAPE